MSVALVRLSPAPSSLSRVSHYTWNATQPPQPRIGRSARRSGLGWRRARSGLRDYSGDMETRGQCRERPVGHIPPVAASFLALFLLFLLIIILLFIFGLPDIGSTDAQEPIRPASTSTS